MAKKEETAKIVLERNYNVPLRKEFQKVANWRKTEKAVTALKQFISKHMKSDDVIISRYANLELWKNGIKNPPHHIKVNASKDEKGKVSVELVELPGKAKRELEELKKADKKKEEAAAKKPEEKAPETKLSSESEKGLEKSKTFQKEDQAKQEEKEELKEIKKEMPKQTPQPLAAAKQVEQRPTAPKGQ